MELGAIYRSLSLEVGPTFRRECGRIGRAMNKPEPQIQRPRRIVWENVLTVASAAILIAPKCSAPRSPAAGRSPICLRSARSARAARRAVRDLRHRRHGAVRPRGEPRRAVYGDRLIRRRRARHARVIGNRFLQLHFVSEPKRLHGAAEWLIGEIAQFRTCLWPCVGRWASGQEAGQPPKEETLLPCSRDRQPEAKPA